MELTLFLSKVIGVYLLVMGIAVLVNRRHIMLAVVSLAKERVAQLIAGVVALLFGLILVNVHNDWSTLPASIISFVGWAGVVKGALYLLLPEAKLAKIVQMFSDRSWYMADGIIAILVGLYLANYGYGLF